MKKKTAKQEEVEEKKVQSEGEKILDFVNSEVWKTIKFALNQKLIMNDAISNIDIEKSNQADVLIEIKARDKATRLVKGWVSEIEGRAVVAEQSKTITQEIREDSFIEYL